MYGFWVKVEGSQFKGLAIGRVVSASLELHAEDCPAEDPEGLGSKSLELPGSSSILPTGFGGVAPGAKNYGQPTIVLLFSV